MTTPSRPSRLPTTRPSAPTGLRPTGAPVTAVVLPAAPAIDVPLLDAAPFEPDAQALRKDAEKGTTEKTEEKTRAQVLHAIHSLALLAPGVVEAMAASASEDDQVERFRAWSLHVRERAAEWAGRWPVDEADLPWVTAALERIVATHPRLLRAEHTDVLMALAFEQCPPPTQAGLPLQVAAPVAMATALAWVGRAQLAFPLGRPDPVNDLEAAARVLAEVGQDAVSELVPPAGSQELRVTVFVAAVEQAGQTLAQFWRQAGQELAAKASQRTKEEQRIWEAANPEGVELEPVFQKFREHGARLRRLALLARPK